MQWVVIIFSTVFNLKSSLGFNSSLSFMFFWRPKERKAPARGKPSLTVLCSGVASNILQSNRHCHLNLSVDFWVMRTSSVSHSLISEHLTSGRTFLSLNPKINRLQAVSFNGAGVSTISPLYAAKFAEYSIAKVIPRQRRKITRK